jgi:hypothetical protein
MLPSYFPLELPLILKQKSILRFHGYCTRPPSMDGYFGSSNEKEGKGRYCMRNELRSLVSKAHNKRASWSLDINPKIRSAGAMAMIKTSYLTDLSKQTDFTC